jgi:serine/threonine protein kinase
MSSGTLPLSTYHRAQALGEGTFGSVVAVYTNDGEEYALKLFLKDDNEERSGMDLGALREISILRILRGDNGHSNIVPMVDVKGEFEEDEEDFGAGTGGCVAMAMPLFKSGTLADALDKGILKACPKRIKVIIAHEFLCAVAYLHDNGIIHRDIKTDNLCLQANEGDGSFSPVLIDFSLAKLVDGTMYTAKNGSTSSPFSKQETETTHTCEVGTVTYTAPEVVDCKPYGLASDMWSVGIILMEMLQNHTLEATKNKEGFKKIQELKETLPDQPFANLVRGLLTVDPDKRLTARQALESPLFRKFGLEPPPVKLIDIHNALPIEEEHEEQDFIENAKPNKSAGKKPKKNPILVKRMKLIRKLCNELDCRHPMTAYAALVYSQQMYLQIDDLLDDLTESQTLLDCVVLASKFFETELIDIQELEGTGSFKDWSLEEFYDNEGTIWMLMDHCLYPRGAMVFGEYE